MHAIIHQSPSVSHKYRVFLPEKRTIDFGLKNARHYTDHHNPLLMRTQLIKKGAIIPDNLRLETDPFVVHREMLKIKESYLEDWDDYNTSEYWERWVLMSYPSIRKSKLFMTMNNGILFTHDEPIDFIIDL